jgi:hypothetical protein
MPNLQRFIITFTVPFSDLSDTIDLLNGYEWYKLLETHISHINVLDIFIYIKYAISSEDLDNILHSFENFSKKYDDWQVIINRLPWVGRIEDEVENIIFRAFRRSNIVRRNPIKGSRRIFGSFDRLDIQSIGISDNEYYRCFPSNIDLYLKINIPFDMKDSDIQLSSQLFKNIDHFILDIESDTTTTFWQDFLSLGKEKLFIP